MNHVVGVSDVKTSNEPADVLTTHALGSCIGVTLYDTVAGAAGMLHFQLPSSMADPRRAAERPLMYADTGMDILLQKLAVLGGDKRRMRVRLAGGAKMLNDQCMFDIGRRNHAAIRKVLWQHGMFIDREMIGGANPMTMQLRVADGAVTVRCNNQSLAF